MTVKRKVECSNPVCGNTIYEPTYKFADDDSGKMTPIWTCMNCHAETPRLTRHRPTNKSRAIDLWKTIREEWKETNEKIERLVAEQTLPSGALLAYSSTWNWHLDRLLNDKLNSWEIKYHASNARKDLEKSKEKINETLA